MSHVPSKLRLSLVMCETAGILLLAACAAGSVQPVTYRVTPGSADARVTYQVRGSDTIVDIRSQTGIGSAQFAQTGGAAPGSLILQLHLKGLEGLDFGYPDATVRVSVSSHDGTVHETVSIEGAAEQSLEPDSPYWMDVKIVAADKTIPLQDGYFTVRAPGSFLTGAKHDFIVRWVDFYR